MFRISHGDKHERIVTDKTVVGKIVAEMIEEGLTNILITREEADVRVTRINTHGPKPSDPVVRTLCFDVDSDEG
jgi:hypothetical protein